MGVHLVQLAASLPFGLTLQVTRVLPHPAQSAGLRASLFP